jgi:uncharacterized membrane protein
MWGKFPGRLWRHLTRASTYRPGAQVEHSPEDLQGLVDGIYAIAATLLVLDLRVPEHEQGHLGEALASIPAAYLAYAFGFVLVLAGWLQIRRLLRLIRVSDHYATCLVLLTATAWAVTPFTMSTLADAMPVGGADAASAVRLVAGVLVLVMLGWAALMTYLNARGFWREGLRPVVAEVWVPASQLIWTLALGAWVLSYVAWQLSLAVLVVYVLLSLVPVEIEAPTTG